MGTKPGSHALLDTRVNAPNRRPLRALPYVLVAVADVVRAAWCLEILKPFRRGALVARDGDDALLILQRFGPPVLLVCDIALPQTDGFLVMEAVRALGVPDLPIIALSPFSTLRSYAERRANLRISAVVSPTGSAEPFQQAVTRALASPFDAPDDWVTSEEEAATVPVGEEIERVLRETAEDAMRITGARGAAVYLQARPEERLRAHVAWVSDTIGPGSPLAPPQLIEWMTQAGEGVVFRDLTEQPFVADLNTSFREAVRGLAAAPVVDALDTIIGAVCAFDSRPVRLGTTEVEALRTLGQRAGLLIAALLWSLVVSRWWLVVGRWSLVVRRWALGVGRW
jgi:CheY-like chemotaxis protein